MTLPSVPRCDSRDNARLHMYAALADALTSPSSKNLLALAARLVTDDAMWSDLARLTARLAEADDQARYGPRDGPGVPNVYACLHGLILNATAAFTAQVDTDPVGDLADFCAALAVQMDTEPEFTGPYVRAFEAEPSPAMIATLDAAPQD